MDYLKGVFNYLTERYKGNRYKTLTRFWYLYQDPLQAKPGFLPCTSFNYLLRILLVHSGRFIDEDIKLVTVPFNGIIHQYTKVKVGSKIIDVDPWSKALSVPFGKHSIFIG